MTERIEQLPGGDVIFSVEPGQRAQPLPVAHVYMALDGTFWRAPRGLVGMCRLAPHDARMVEHLIAKRGIPEPTSSPAIPSSSDGGMHLVQEHVQPAQGRPGAAILFCILPHGVFRRLPGLGRARASTGCGGYRKSEKRTGETCTLWSGVLRR